MAPTGIKTVLLRDNFTNAALPGWDVISGRQLPAKTGTPAGPDGFGTQEIQTMRPSNLTTSASQGLSVRVNNEGGVWYGARMEYKTPFKPSLGQTLRFEAAITLPDITGAAAAGYWFAFWALGAPYYEDRSCWPQCGELDFMEAINGIEKAYQTIHFGHWTKDTGSLNVGVNPSVTWGEPDGLGNGGAALDVWGTRRVYAFEWDRTHGAGLDVIRFIVDDVVTIAINEADVRPLTWGSAFGHTGYYPIINGAMGGSFPAAFGGGPTASTVASASMKVEYVEVANYGTATAPSGGTGTGTGTPSDIGINVVGDDPVLTTSLNRVSTIGALTGALKKQIALV